MLVSSGRLRDRCWPPRAIWKVRGTRLRKRRLLSVQIGGSYYGGMVLGLKSRASWVLCIVGIITVGILSRVALTGLAVVDKYLGDALYAAMVYTILRLFWRAAAPARVAVSAMAVMTAIELFQLTMISRPLPGRS